MIEVSCWCKNFYLGMERKQFHYQLPYGFLHFFNCKLASIGTNLEPIDVRINHYQYNNHEEKTSTSTSKLNLFECKCIVIESGQVK